jgi:hypothetical protein
MIEVRQIETAPGLVFDVAVAGPDAGPPVLMLHASPGTSGRLKWKRSTRQATALWLRASAATPEVRDPIRWISKSSLSTG